MANRCISCLLMSHLSFMSLAYFKVMRTYVKVCICHTYSWSVRFFKYVHLAPNYLLATSCLAICLHVSAWLPLDRFSWSLKLRTFVKICQETPNLVTVWQKCWALYMKTRAPLYFYSSTEYFVGQQYKGNILLCFHGNNNNLNTTQCQIFHLVSVGCWKWHQYF
jgi:hypothetical protein